MTLKIAVFAPIPMASVPTATAVNSGSERSRRSTCLRRMPVYTKGGNEGFPAGRRRLSFGVRWAVPARPWFRSTSAAGDALRGEQSIAAARAFLAVAGLIALRLDSAQPASYATFTYLVLCVYTGVSISALVAIRVNRPAAARLRAVDARNGHRGRSGCRPYH